MKLTEALLTIQSGKKQGRSITYLLACGFTPLHLKTFLAAHLQKATTDAAVVVETGLFGDLAGTLAAPAASSCHGVAVALEWSDLDPRLGFRQLGGWGAAQGADMLAQLGQTLSRLEQAIGRIPSHIPVAVSGPTLPLPPAFLNPVWQAGQVETRLRASVAGFLDQIAARTNVSIVSAQFLDGQSAPAQRYDAKSDLWNGFPYTVAHAGELALSLARLLRPPAPKKGLITDLDDTLWGGIAGEIGPESVTWDLSSHTQLHGLYQQMLRALAEQGVLIAVASKNELATAEAAFQRDDILFPAKHVFPFEVHWNPKSGSIGRILQAWNISAEQVIFIDDSPLELAEAGAAHPGLECILFPKQDYAAGLELLYTLRAYFGKARVSEEDSYRLESLRTAAMLREQSGAGESGQASGEEILRNAGAAISIDDAPGDPRTLELVNKTNQFNLNGKRWTEPEWREAMAIGGGFALTVSYQDKYGPLGKIAAIRGTRSGRKVLVDTWVMSCRAFSRRIEDQCLRLLFQRFDADEIELAFAATVKNGPMREFLGRYLGQEPDGTVRLTRHQCTTQFPALYHLLANENL